MMPTPIETRYAGCRFRSRLEARWAVFFDAIGLRWEYEREGYDLDGIWYLPDFWLPQFGYWIEIKGQTPVDAEWHKAEQLMTRTQSATLLFWGSIGPDVSGAMIVPNTTEAGADYGTIRHEAIHWIICPICGRLCLGMRMDDERKLFVICGASCSPFRVRAEARLDRYDPRRHPAIEDAYAAARSARFE